MSRLLLLAAFCLAMALVSGCAAVRRSAIQPEHRSSVRCDCDCEVRALEPSVERDLGDRVLARHFLEKSGCRLAGDDAAGGAVLWVCPVEDGR